MVIAGNYRGADTGEGMEEFGGSDVKEEELRKRPANCRANQPLERQCFLRLENVHGKEIFLA